MTLSLNVEKNGRTILPDRRVGGADFYRGTGKARETRRRRYRDISTGGLLFFTTA